MQFELLDQWDELMSTFPAEKNDIYFYRKYVALYEDNGHKALCAVCRDDDNIMLMPFISSKIEDYYDFETAYGYGGPVSNSCDESWNKKAFWGIYDCLKSNNYLCGFTRFHPIIGNENLCPSDSKERNIGVFYNRQTISIDTSKGIDDIWNWQISSKNRNMIRKAEKAGLVYKTEFDFASYDGFIELYTETMKRLSAEDFYFFDTEYFYKLRDTLSGNVFLGTVRKDEKLICAAIFMYKGLYGHYHLAGSDKQYSSFGANNYMLWKVACEMNKLGVKNFHLGGGTSSSIDDSLFKFKKSFSRKENKFFIGKEIFQPDIYADICKKWAQNYPEKIELFGNRLLKYRY